MENMTSTKNWIITHLVKKGKEKNVFYQNMYKY